MLLVGQGDVPPVVKDEVRRLARDHVTVLGGHAAVDDATFADLDLR